MKLMHTDNFGGDYPDEKFVKELPRLREESLKQIAKIINDDIGPLADRHYKVVADDYVLQPGFEP